MEEMKYYYCKTCNKAVPVTQKRCNICNYRFDRDTSYSKSQIEAKIAGGSSDKAAQQGMQQSGMQQNGMQQNGIQQGGIQQSVQSQDMGGRARLVCPICKTEYDEMHSICEKCGVPLLTLNISAAQQPMQAAVQQPMQPAVQQPMQAVVQQPVQAAPQLPFAASDDILEMIPFPDKGKGDYLGTALEKSDWEVKIKGYYQGTAYEGRTIDMNRSYISLGREYFVNSASFTAEAGYGAVFGRVSRYNGHLIVQDGELYLQYDNIESHKGSGKHKGSLTVNGQLLKDNERRRLLDHDIVRIGYRGQSSLDGCVEMEVVKKQPANAEQSLEIASLMEEIKSLSQTVKNTEEMQKKTLEQVIETGSLVQKMSEIDVSNFQDFDTYLAALKEFERRQRNEGSLRSREEYIDDFLGDMEHKEDFLACLSEAQMEYLYYAAYYEAMAKLNTQVEMDYSASFSYMGKILENFAHQTMRPMIERFHPKRWESLQEKMEREGRISLGDITKAFVKWEYPTDEDRKNYTNGTRQALGWLIKEMVMAYTGNRQKVDQKLFKEMSAAFVAADTARNSRNNSAHSSIEAVLVSELQKVTYDDFLHDKNILLNSNCLPLIKKYSDKIFGKR